MPRSIWKYQSRYDLLKIANMIVFLELGYMKKSMIYRINLYKNRKWNNYIFNTMSYMMMIFLFKQM